ncbi:hypothetical protein [Rubrolithibacter danxiaensis]|uniref:hypothetical protein n=1 Tax=Rubrolithibacter danxiaensis TaxID=3390805 RepID=UPI003BF9003C
MLALKPLSNFFSAIANDPRISITHIGIYAALLQYWQEHNFENPMCAFSHEIMRIAKISASTTYHKCIRDLNDFGYVKYEPSHNRNRASKIYLTNF